MKKTLMTVLIFAVVLAVLMGAAALAERMRPEKPETEEEALASEDTVITNDMTPDKATTIQLHDDGASFLGVGAEARDGVVTIAYPGTYRVSGALEGQLVVDLGDFHGGVYILLDGADVTCADGPALYVKQADLTVLQLTEGTENSFRDGPGYSVDEGTVQQTGAAIYSADDLVIQGDGSLTVTGAAADGIRSKDALTIAGGALRIYAADDGLQASDCVEMTGGDVYVGAYGDGVATTEGYINVSGGTLTVAAGRDGVDAMTDLLISGSAVNVTAHGGPGYYADIVISDVSAKGLKAAGNISIYGGTVTLSTADDGIHGDGNVTVTESGLTIASGDDAVSAGAELAVTGGEVKISQCYEGLEADTVRLAYTNVTAAAQNNGLSAGEGGLTAEGTGLHLEASRAVSSLGAVSLRGGELILDADGGDSLFKLPSIELVGTTVLACAGTNDAEILTEKGTVNGSMLFLFRDAVEAGTEFVLADSAGNEVLTFSREEDVKAVLFYSGALRDGESYTLTAGETSLTGTPAAGGCKIIEPEGGLSAAWGFPGGGFPGGGPGGGPRR